MAGKPRARELGIPFPGAPGPLNAIADVPGVEVGHATLIEGHSIRTGVTAIHPRGKSNGNPVYAGWFSLNGNGEMTGTAWIDEAGLLYDPVLITNTHSVGVARDACIRWQIEHGRERLWFLPVVAETYDGYLNDINGFHVKPEHVWAALDSAAANATEEGSVGGGTGMICYGFKGGIGTASRVAGGSTVGVLVQANHGSRSQLRLPAGGRPSRKVRSRTPIVGRLLSFLRPTHPCCRISSRRSLDARHLAWPGRVRLLPSAREISSSLSRLGMPWPDL